MAKARACVAGISGSAARRHSWASAVALPASNARASGASSPVCHAPSPSRSSGSFPAETLTTLLTLLKEVAAPPSSPKMSLTQTLNASARRHSTFDIAHVKNGSFGQRTGYMTSLRTFNDQKANEQLPTHPRNDSPAISPKHLRSMDFDVYGYSSEALVDVAVQIFAEASYCWGRESGLLEAFSDLERFSLFLAALCHDLEHPGVTGAFLVSTNAAIAQAYGHQPTCLEQHHSACARRLLLHTHRPLLSELSPADRAAVVECVESLILATDMTRHTHFVAALGALAAARTPTPPRSAAADGALMPAPAGVRAECVCQGESGVGLDAAERRLMGQALLKCADISNVCRPFPVARRWAARISEELYRQGDMERARGLPVSPYCDRRAPAPFKMQHGFIDAVAAPMYRAAAALFCALRPAAARLADNRREWARLESEASENSERSASVNSERSALNLNGELATVLTVLSSEHSALGGGLSVLKAGALSARNSEPSVLISELSEGEGPALLVAASTAAAASVGGGDNGTGPAAVRRIGGGVAACV